VSEKNDKPLTARIFTLDMLVWSMVTIFSFGAGYTALAKDNEAQTEAILDIKEAQKAVDSDISQIKISIGSISATQSAMSAHIRRQQDTIDKRMERQENDIRDILGILRANHKQVHQ